MINLFFQATGSTEKIQVSSNIELRKLSTQLVELMEDPAAADGIFFAHHVINEATPFEFEVPFSTTARLLVTENVIADRGMYDDENLIPRRAQMYYNRAISVAKRRLKHAVIRAGLPETP